MFNPTGVCNMGGRNRLLPYDYLCVGEIKWVSSAACMGSGIGATFVGKGDYDIVTSDPESVKEYKLDQIRFGGFVALMDHDNRYGRAYRKGAVTIGVAVHSDCLIAGHGPGVAMNF